MVFLGAGGFTYAAGPLNIGDLAPARTSWSSPVERLNDYVEIEVGSLKSRHWRKTIKSYRAAFEDNPTLRYFRDGKSKIGRIERIPLVWEFITHIGTKIAIPIDRGTSVVIASNSTPRDRRSLKEEFAGWIVIVLYKTLTTKKTHRRMKEFGTKLVEAIKGVDIGEREKGMITVHQIFTAPDSEGRGYAKTLLGTIIDMADRQDRPTWLISSNLKNEALYNSHGFESVAEIVLGDEDWHDKPVVVQLMVREPMN